MRICFLFVGFLFSFSLWAQSAPDEDYSKLEEEKGYKNLKFGSSYEEIKLFLHREPASVYPKMKLSYFSIKATSLLKIGNTKIDEGTVGFFRDTLQSITLKIYDVKKGKKIFESLEDYYGKPKEILKNVLYQWEAKSVEMSYNEKAKEVIIYIIQKKTEREKALTTSK